MKILILLAIVLLSGCSDADQDKPQLGKQRSDAEQILFDQIMKDRQQREENQVL